MAKKISRADELALKAFKKLFKKCSDEEKEKINNKIISQKMFIAKE